MDIQSVQFYLDILKEEPVFSTHSTDINDYYETIMTITNWYQHKYKQTDILAKTEIPYLHNHSMYNKDNSEIQ